LGEKKNSNKEEEKGTKLVNTKKPCSTPNFSWIELVVLPPSIEYITEMSILPK
jgi:hypothetical protein